jgi:hypothetical protein
MNSPSGPMISPGVVPENFMPGLRAGSSDKVSESGPTPNADRSEDERKVFLTGASSLWREPKQTQVSPTLLTKRVTDCLPCGSSTSTSNKPEVKVPIKRKHRPDSPHSHLASSSSAGSTPSVTTHHLQIRAEYGHAIFHGQPNGKHRLDFFRPDDLSEITETIAQEDIERGSMAGAAHSNNHDIDDCVPLDQVRTSPPISNTLAVIKATAFGALRRNRSLRKRGDNHATKVALEALEARGLGLGLQPTMTLSSAHNVAVASADDEDRRTSVRLEDGLLEDQSI